VPVPLIDSVSAGAQWAIEATRTATPAATKAGFGIAWQNVSWELEALG
jgi:hypothetical protein